MGPSVLVTRPAGQAAALCAGVEAAGCSAHCQPLLELQGLPELTAQQRQCLLQLDGYQHVIFISANAVHFGMRWIGDFWPQLPVGLGWYAVGEATARRLRSYGVDAITPTVMTSEGLLALQPLQGVNSERILIVKGEGGRATLGEALAERGARVDELACYRRIRPSLAAGELAARLAGWGIEVAMISSGEALANLLALLSPQETTNFTSVSLIVPSARVARMARKAGFEQVLTAENASDGAMLCALEEWTASAI